MISKCWIFACGKATSALSYINLLKGDRYFLIEVLMMSK